MFAVNVPAIVGVPEIVPVVAFKFTPGAKGDGAELQAPATWGDVVSLRAVKALPTAPVTV
jgi:hypothetical protein